MNPLLASGLTAAVMSERARGLLRQSAVYGLAGVRTAAEAVATSARSAAQVASPAGDMVGDLIGEAGPRDGRA